MTHTAKEPDSRENELPVIELMGLPIHAVSEDECVRRIFDELGLGRGGWVVTPNLDHLRRFVHSAEFRALYDQASLSVADGMPLIWASWLQGTPLPERVTGSNLIWSLSAEAARRGRSLYLFGGDPGTADEAADILGERFPGLVIAGTDCPAFGFEQDPESLASALAKIRLAQPDLVLVALGSPKQEVVIGLIRDQLPDAWWIGVGISRSRPMRTTVPLSASSSRGRPRSRSISMEGLSPGGALSAKAIVSSTIPSLS